MGQNEVAQEDGLLRRKAKNGYFGWKTGKGGRLSVRVDRNILEREELFGSDRLGNNQELKNGIEGWKNERGVVGGNIPTSRIGEHPPFPRGWAGNSAPGDV